jgi:putative transposase
MPRPPRLHVPGAFYHVTLRGNHRQNIFYSAADRDLLDFITAEILSRFAARLHAHCWMTDHIHLVIQVSDAPLGKLMLHIAGGYAREGRVARRGDGSLGRSNLEVI